MNKLRQISTILLIFYIGATSIQYIHAFDFSKTEIAVNNQSDMFKEIYKVINDNDEEVYLLLKSLSKQAIDENDNKINDKIIAKICKYSDGALSESLGNLIFETIKTRPKFVSNICSDDNFEFVINLLYCEIVLRSEDPKERTTYITPDLKSKFKMLSDEEYNILIEALSEAEAYYQYRSTTNNSLSNEDSGKEK